MSAQRVEETEEKPLCVEKARDLDTPGLTTYGGDQGEKPVTDQVSSYTGHYGKDGSTVTDREKREKLDSKRAEGTSEMCKSFYNLVTDFYEYGWGQSFHFAPVYGDMTFDELIADYERGIAKSLDAGPGKKILVNELRSYVD